MPCYHPNYACFVEGRAQPKILGQYVREDLPGKIFYEGKMRELLRLPCGQCVGCRLAYSRQWADRCTMESLTTPENQSWFVTLTYNDDNLPPVDSSSPYPGTLDFDDHQDFMKRLRINYQRHYEYSNIRHYTAGEYGLESLRPHYHSIIYNLPLADIDGDLTRHSVNKFGDVLYRSKLLEDTWPFGFVIVGKNTWRTAAYTARYVLKKRKGKDSKQWYENLDIIPENTRASNRPGIADAYFWENYEKIYYGNSQKIVLPSIGDMPNITTPPRFFDDKFKKIDPERLEAVKLKRREIAEEVSRTRMELLGITGCEDDYFAHLEENILKRPNFRLDI